MNQFLARLASINYQKILIGGVLLGVVYYIGFYDDGSSIDAQVVTTQGQIAEEEQRQVGADKTIKQADILRSEVAGLTEKYKEISTKLPTEVQMAEVLNLIDTMAAASGISVKGKEPRKGEQKKVLEEIPIRVMAEGGFSQLTLFLFNMMNSEHFSRVTGFSISRAAGKSGAGKPLSMEVTISNYRYLGEGKTGTAESGGAN